MPETSLKYKIRNLMMQYSAQEIYTTVNEVFREDYAFYQTIFNVPVVPVAQQPPPQEQTTPLTQDPPAVETVISNTTKLRPNAMIRVVKKEIQQVVPEVQNLAAHDEEASVVSVNVNEKECRAQIKREQSENESKKYAELLARGIDPETLLTKDNLKKWIETDKLTYAQISRDHVGLPSAQVSTVAKGFGFKSQIAKRRAMILASKK